VRTIVPNVAAPINAFTLWVLVENKGAVCQIAFTQDSNVGNIVTEFDYLGIDVGDVVMLGILKADVPTEINCIDIAVTVTTLVSIYQPISIWAHNV
jgi:paraquat-inducible protein B